MLTKGAIGNLVNRYKAVLKKCNLINTFGSLAVASMLVMGGAGVAEAVQLGDTATYTAPLPVTELIGNNKTELTLIGESEKDGTNPTISAGSNDVLIKDISTIIFKSGWGTGESTYGSNATVASNGCIISINNVKNIKNDGYIAGHNYFFHAFGGKYEFNNIGSIDIQSGGIGFMAQPIRNNNAIIEVKNAENINIKTMGAAVQSSVFTGDATGYASISLHAKNITLESSPNNACVTIFNKFNGNVYKNEGYIKITADETLRITGSAAVNANYGTDGMQDAIVELAAKNIIITSNAPGTSADDYPYALRARDNAAIFVNATDTATITGNVEALRNSLVDITVGGSSTLTGDINIDDTSSFNVTLADGDASLTVDADSVTGTIAVSGSGAANDAAGGDAEALLAKVQDANGDALTNTTFAGMEEGFLYGAVSEAGEAPKSNTAIEDTLELATTAPLAIGRIVMNDVRKRMGDLRDTKEDSGVWMRWDGGKLKGDAGLTNNFNTIQVGADMMTGIQNVRAGVAAAFTHGDLDHRNGEGEMETYSFSAYGTWMAENGMFADVIARVGFTNTELTMKGNRIDLDNEALSLSGEFGWRFDLCKQFYVEPQVELTYTYLTEADTKVSYADYSLDSMDSLIGRAGLAAGWKLPNDRGNIYARASVVHEFLGDSELSATAFGNTVAHSEDGEDTWLEYGIGANVKLTDSTYVWADVERTAGADIEEEWRGTVGIRYSF